MDFRDSPEEAEFRSRLRAWIAENNPGLPVSSTDDEYWARQAEWHTALYDAGFFGLSWPARFGGHDLPSVFDVILDEELAAAGAPPRPSLGYLVQGITTHASESVQERFLPGLISGRERWCQGFSEPDAGSDLAALRTAATRDGDEYVIHGHKIWTSYSDVADWCFLLARTDPDVPKHKGLSAFAVPMHQPGIEQYPLRMINGITKEFGQVVFDGARVPAANMIGKPGEGWRIAMTIVSHEREPGEVGYVARYAKTVKDLEAAVRADPGAFRSDQREAVAWGYVQAEMLRLHVRRRLSERLDGLDHGPGGSIDKILMTWVEQTVGAAALSVAGSRAVADWRRRGAEDLPLQPRPERDGRHLADPEEHHRHADPRPPDGLSAPRARGGESMDYSLPDEVRVETDGPVRIVRLARPDQLNAVNEDLHLGLTRVFPLLSADPDARVAVITGEGRAFSAGGDFDLLDRMVKDRALRRDVIAEGRELVRNMIRCRVPVVAAVNGPAVGLGCSVIALSDVVYMAESAYLADPHVAVGLVAADGGPLTWPLHTSLLLAKEYAFTGDRISAARAKEIGLANHVCPDGEVLSAALAAAHRIAALPRQAVEATKRILNLHVERAVLATIDFAMAAETESFDTTELQENVARFLKRSSAKK